MRIYLTLLWMQLRTSLVLAFQYRADFAMEGVVELFWTVTTLAPLFVLFHDRAAVAGWSYGEMLIVAGFFTLLSAVLEGLVNPAMALVVEQIRKGTFDFVLLKPKDSQFLVSTARVLPWRALNIVTALAIFAYGFHVLHRVPRAVDIATASLLLVLATIILYSLWMLSVAAAFYVVKVDNLTFLFGSVFDAARWPQSIFRGLLRILFTFVIPLSMMTTYPAQALLGRAESGQVVYAVLTAALSFAISRAVWNRAIRSYTSASS